MTTIANTNPADELTLDLMVPDLLRAHPHARSVLDAYGLRGCGGLLGPAETLRFFARTHGVDGQRLLRELHRSAATPPPAARYVADPAGVADTIYRRYFLAAIVLIVTAGATWGAWLLWQIGFAGKFTGVSIHHVNAHGHAQIYGWVGLFIMGFAYQAFPRIWHTTLAGPTWAVAAFALMAFGLVVRTAGMTAAGATEHATCAAMVGGAAELAAVAIFAAQVLVTFRRSPAAVEPYVGFAFMAVLWFVAQALLDVWHTWTTMTAATQKELLWYVATYQAPLRDLQIHGLALFMILGVSMRMLPALFDVPPVPPRRAWWALGVLTAAVVGEAVVFVAYRWTQNHALAALLMVPWLMLAAGCAMAALPWRLWRPMKVRDRSGKFVRAAYAWLAASLLMLLLLPAYQALSGMPFSHAYYGATRHAITVGFVSLMIMGMAAKVVPTLNGVDPRRLPQLWAPFVLVNAGCFLRVSLQTLTDWHPAFFMAIGISGVMEVTGLGWWGLHLARIMLRGRREIAGDDTATHADAPDHVAGDMFVADVLRWFPETADVFDRYGFTPLRSAVARRTIARGVTLAQAATLRRVPLRNLVSDLAATAGVGAELEGEPTPASSTPASTRT
jgi:hypothetical protein